MNAEQINHSEANLEAKHQRELAAKTARFVHLLKRCAQDPDNCPDPEILPYLEAYRLLTGNLEQLHEFYQVLLDDSDPRLETYKFVLNACARHNAEVYYLRLRGKFREEFA